MTRVTPATLNSGVMAGLQSSLSRLQQTQEQLASGRRLSRPSDSPVDTVAAMRLRAERKQSDQLARNIDDGMSWLNTTDQALGQTSSVLNRVRSLVLAGASSTNGPDERRAMAAEVDQLREAMIGIANTQYLGRPVFAGTQDTAAAFDPTTGAYAGNGATRAAHHLARLRLGHLVGQRARHPGLHHAAARPQRPGWSRRAHPDQQRPARR